MISLKNIKLLPVLIAIFVGLFILPSVAFACPVPVEKVNICHATNSQTNPYVQNQPAKSGDVEGHDGHNGPVWYPGIADHSWGDIIPPFDYSGGHYPGKNWTTSGQDIWNNGCIVPPQYSSISGTKFEDLDGDSSKDAGESGLQNWTIYIDTNDNGTLDGGETSVTTDSSGNYTFTNLVAGTYIVREQNQSGWFQTLPTAGKYNVSLGAGQNLSGYDFGNYLLPTTGSLTICKYNDLDGNETGDLPMSWNLTVVKQDGAGGTWYTSTNGETGCVTLTGMPFGNYLISEEQVTGWEQTYPHSNGTWGDQWLEINTQTLSPDTAFYNHQIPETPDNGLTLTKHNDKEDSFINPGMEVNYTLVVTNSGEGNLYNVEVVDNLPNGFTYKAGSGKINGVVTEPTIMGSILIWHIDMTLEPGQEATITYTLTAGSDVPKGIYTNIAQAQGLDRDKKTVSTEKVKSSVEVKIPSVLSETTETGPAVLPNTGGELPIFPLILTFLGSTLAIIERSVRKLLSK
jgi:uncharacterized repeat protein (TIGR01451 family)